KVDGATVGIHEEVVDPVVLVAELLVGNEVPLAGEHDGALVGAHHRGQDVDAAQRLHRYLELLSTLGEVETRGRQFAGDGRLGGVELASFSFDGHAMFGVRFEKPPLVGRAFVGLEGTYLGKRSRNADVGVVTGGGQKERGSIDPKAPRSGHVEYAFAKGERQA